MNKFLLILAYFLKYGGIIGVLCIIALVIVLHIALSGLDQPGFFTPTFLPFIIPFFALFFIGNTWSKKLLRE